MGAFTSLPDALARLLDAGAKDLAGQGRPVAAVWVAQGDEAVIDECCAGALWVRVAQIDAPEDSRPSARGNLGTCAPAAWNVTVEMGHARCVDLPGSDGTAPSARVQTRESMTTVADMAVLLSTLKSLRFVSGAFTPTWSPLTVAGGCAGGVWTFVVKVCL